MYPYSYKRVYKHDRFRITCCCSRSHWLKSSELRGKKFIIIALKKQSISKRYFAVSSSLWITAFKLSLIRLLRLCKRKRNRFRLLSSRIHMNIYYLYFTIDQTSSANVNSRFIPRCNKYLICNKLNYIAHKFVVVYDHTIQAFQAIFLTDTTRSNRGNLPL